MGTTLTRLLLGAGHEVKSSNSRTGTNAEVVAFGEVVVLATRRLLTAVEARELLRTPSASLRPC